MALPLNPGTALGLVAPVIEKKGEWPTNFEDVPIPAFDTGVFITELANVGRLPQELEDVTREDLTRLRENPESILAKAQDQRLPKLHEGTFRGTQLALTKIHDLVERKYSSFMDAANFEPTVPSPLSLEQKRKFFNFSDPATDKYPPHLNLAGKRSNKVATGEDVGTVPGGSNQRADMGPGDLFNKLRLAQLTTLLPSLIPDSFLDHVAAEAGGLAAKIAFGGFGTPDQGTSIHEIEVYNKKKRDQWWYQKDIFDIPNIGDLPDWYTDKRFAQQSFTGTNPATIELATDFWIQHFIDAAVDPSDALMREKILKLASADRFSLYMHDYSYFRKAAGMEESQIISCKFEETVRENGQTTKRTSQRYGVAAVCLYHLPDSGQLQPLAIVLDWRGSAENSVTVYNRELNTSDQAHDWAWRYAKTCVQTSDWMKHEVTSHLTNTHMVEEATIVAAQRSFENDHPVFKLLYPHWQKTLSLNAAARDTLVPHVIVPLIGFEDERAYEFIRSEYRSFDFQGSYVPNELERRGFPVAKLDHRRYHNYAYARCIHSMWWKIHSFVTEMLSISYGQDEQGADVRVAADENVRMWYTQMQAPAGGTNPGADIPTFPTITTFSGLVDAVTMCIHLASPQHTAVNYLQNYYQAFVINRPPCLYTPPPTTREQLFAYKEQELVKALPVNHTTEWLLASHIPYLLSFKPGDKESLIIYAASKFHVYKGKTGGDDQAIANAAASFYTALARSELEFRKYGQDVDDSNEILYEVLSPSWNAVSILI